MKLTQKGTRAPEVAVTAEEFPQLFQKSVANIEEVEEDDATLDSNKRDKDIKDWIVWLRIPLTRNKDEKADAKEEEVCATQSLTEDNSPINEYEGGREYELEYVRKDTVLSDVKNTEEEALSRHEGE